MNRSRVKLIVFALVAALMCAMPAMADGKHAVRFGVQQVMPTGDYSETFSTTTESIEADDATGIFFEYEYGVTGRVGIFGNLSFQTHDVDYSEVDTSVPSSFEATIGEVDLMLLEVGANFYIVNSDTVAFYVGPKIVSAMVGDVELNDVFGPGEVPTDDDIGFGVNVGADWKFGESGWALLTGVQYMTFSTEVDNDFDLDIDPIAVRVGAAKRW